MTPAFAAAPSRTYRRGQWDPLTNPIGHRPIRDTRLRRVDANTPGTRSARPEAEDNSQTPIQFHGRAVDALPANRKDIPTVTGLSNGRGGELAQTMTFGWQNGGATI
ncbi:hypothetical protein MMUR_39960 [Mycolicibacterium murale]|uniref:Uncharacterized protein n=1 Tax=Mycolicibacterium murale TaxID=182220 RepID=A0A7I9WR67_9MYCO|nr:hypothetical protein MMUR_39960 [Mycolicibacterium murale]